MCVCVSCALLHQLPRTRVDCRCLERVIARRVVQLELPADVSEAPAEEVERVQVGVGVSVYAFWRAWLCSVSLLCFTANAERAQLINTPT